MRPHVVICLVWACGCWCTLADKETGPTASVEFLLRDGRGPSLLSSQLLDTHPPRSQPLRPRTRVPAEVLQRVAAATFNVQRHLTSRNTLRVLRVDVSRIWRAATAAEARAGPSKLRAAQLGSRDRPTL